MKPKYALYEIERRWLVPSKCAAPLLAPEPILVTDKYLTDTRLRLRRMEFPEGGTVYKFCKKYGGRHGAVEPITNLYLNEQEYRCLADLPGVTVTKRRHRQTHGAVDVYDLPDGALYVFEIEFEQESDAAAFRAPPFVSREITENDAFSGFALAQRASR